MRSLLSILTHSAPNPRLRVQNFQSVSGTSERLSSFCIEAHFITNNDHHKQSQVGFYGPTAPPGPNAPSSRICGQNPPNDADASFLDLHIVNCHCQDAAARWCCTPLPGSAYHSIGGRLPEWQTSKCISSVSFVRIESNFFYNTQETQTQKRWTRI